MRFKEIKAKECPNIECKQVIPEKWEAYYQNDMCPRCGFGFDEEKLIQWREKRIAVNE